MTVGVAPRSQAHAQAVARCCFIALGASIPISTALDGLLTGLILAAWIIAARSRKALPTALANPVTAMACLWFFFHLVGAIYSLGEGADIARSVSKSAMFLLIPIAASMVPDQVVARRAHYAFMSAVALTVLLSYLRWAGVISPEAPLLKSGVSTVFKFYLTQNLLVAFGAFVFAVYARRTSNPRMRFFLATCGGLSAADVLLVGEGRTGQIVLLVLGVYYGIWCLGKRGFLAAALGAIAVGAAAYAVPGSSLNQRMSIAIGDAVFWRPGVPQLSGVGERLDFYSRSFMMISARPLLGVGTGGFVNADRQLASERGMPPTKNPHNEFLLQIVELGVAGLLLMLALFWVSWREAVKLPDPGHVALARGLVLTFALASLGTSTFNDHAESLLYIWMTAILFAQLPGQAYRTAPVALERS